MKLTIHQYFQGFTKLFPEFNFEPLIQTLDKTPRVHQYQRFFPESHFESKE
jgi:hypothetical protein